MELPGKVALMTGATGFVGRRTAQRLVLAGMRVRGLMRRTAYWSVRMAYRIAAGDLALPGDGLATLPAVHVDNLIDAILLARRADTVVGQASNIIDGQTTWRAHTEYFRRWLGVGPLPSLPFEAVPPGYRWRGRCSGEKATRELGYSPRVTYAEAMAEAERYLRESGLIKE
jgi:nucleoside-diphosphate-sugar epimerase